MSGANWRDEIDRAAKAEAFLRETLVVEAFEKLEADFIDAWKNTAVADTENRERIFHLLQALNALRGHFKTVVESGKIAQVNLDNQQRG